MLLGLNAVLVVVVVAVVVALTRGDDAPARDGATVARVDRFDEDRAWAELRRQVALGPRPAGSAASRRLAERLAGELPGGRLEPLGPAHPRLRNVVGVLPGAQPAIVVAAHYDTKRLAGFVGANDGAAGTAAVLEIARALGARPRPDGAREVRFVLFDGEEASNDRRPFEETGLRGSRAYARRHAADIGALVLLDFVAGRGMRIRREANSNAALWEELREAAGRVGAAAAFPPGTGAGITDDHVPFLRRGVPAIDLIEWPYACWHRPCDDLSSVSKRSLDRTGETVVELVSRLVGP